MAYPSPVDFAQAVAALLDALAATLSLAPEYNELYFDLADINQRKCQLAYVRTATPPKREVTITMSRRFLQLVATGSGSFQEYRSQQDNGPIIWRRLLGRTGV